MKRASEVYRESMVNHNRIRHEWEAKVEPEQMAFIEEAIAESVAEGKPLFETVVDWQLTPKVKQTLLDLGYAVGERRGTLFGVEDRQILTVCWAPQGITS
jgi:hypothetical protein